MSTLGKFPFHVLLWDKDSAMLRVAGSYPTTSSKARKG
jgi:hypothetical protein